MGIHFQCFKKFSPCYKVIRYISSLIPYKGEKGEQTISRKASLFRKCKGYCFVSFSSAGVPATALHFDILGQSVGGDL